MIEKVKKIKAGKGEIKITYLSINILNHWQTRFEETEEKTTLFPNPIIINITLPRGLTETASVIALLIFCNKQKNSVRTTTFCGDYYYIMEFFLLFLNFFPLFRLIPARPVYNNNTLFILFERVLHNTNDCFSFEFSLVVNIILHI